MGHFYLVNKLLPIIKQNRSRIINLYSCGHYLFHEAKDMTVWFNVENAFKGPTEILLINIIMSLVKCEIYYLVEN